MQTKTDTLVERVEELVQAENPPRIWGNPQLSCTPSSLAIRELGARTDALQDAVREIAREVQRLSVLAPSGASASESDTTPSHPCSSSAEPGSQAIVAR